MAPEEDTQPDVSQPENGGDASGDAVVQGPEATEAPDQTPSQEAAGGLEGPSLDGPILPVPTETAAPTETPAAETTEEPEITEAPEATEAPSAGTPFGEGMLAFDSEEEALAYLWSLEDDEYGIMPIGEAEPNTPVDPRYFRFSIYNANGAKLVKGYDSFTDLKTNGPADGYTVETTEWPNGPMGGDVQGKDSEDVLETYPQITGYEIGSIQINENVIYHLGMYHVGENDYVHFTTIDSKGRMTTVVLTQEASAYASAPFEVRYVPKEYTITYEVYEDANDVTETRKAGVFGENAATETVDHWASVDVTIPAGYTGQVYISDSTDFESGDDYLTHVQYPSEETYGNYALGAEPVYVYTPGVNHNTNTIDIDRGQGPGSYSLTGTYLVGSAGEGVKANQTVRVVLTKKTGITFHAEAWKDYWIGGTDTANKIDVSGNAGAEADGWTMKGAPSEEEVNFTWSFAVKASYIDGQRNNTTGAELRTLEINGANISIPFVSSTTTADPKTTTLPSGAKVTVAAAWTDNRPSYTITVTGATRDVWITGGSINTGSNNTYKELIMSGLYGVDVQLWTSDNDGSWTDAKTGRTLCTGYNWGTDPHYENDRNFSDAGLKFQ